MTQLININTPKGQYQAIAASATNTNLGAVGATGDYLKGIIIIGGSPTMGVVTVKDGTTAVITTTVATAAVMPYVQYIPIESYSVNGAWNISTGANVSVFAEGQFT